MLVPFACAPAQPEATAGCESIVDCDLDSVCDRSIGQCIPQPPNRFLGEFHCQVIDGSPFTMLELSEVTGAIQGDRWSLPSAFCLLQSMSDLLVLGFSDPGKNGYQFSVTVSASQISAGPVRLGPSFDIGLNSATMENADAFTAFGYSASGTVEVTPQPTLGQELDGYLDVDMYPVSGGEASFGIPCPRGLADCGSKTVDAGGAAFCATPQNINGLSGPMCTRACAGTGDCSVGNGVCVQGGCTLACTSNAGCMAPLVCTPGKPGEGSGCF
jgi:hypothetical protein